ncbi:MAG: signal peptidase I [Fimbriimonadaceae bacterium]|nr:signal peptidase I [Fimbriimonadaceae bacterium]
MKVVSWSNVSVRWAAGVILAAVAYAAQPYRAVVVVGESMAPTFRNGSVIWVDSRVPAEIHRNDVVLVRTPEGIHVKRVAFVGGDRYYRWKDRFGVTDMVQTRPSRNSSRHLLTAEVPADHIYLMGDQSTRSVDSRHYGPVRRDQVLGVVPGAGPTPESSQVVFAPVARPAKRPVEVCCEPRMQPISIP